MAACAKRGCPPMYSERRTLPWGVIQSLILTAPCKFICLAIWGYSGACFETTFRSLLSWAPTLPIRRRQSNVMCLIFLMGIFSEDKPDYRLQQTRIARSIDGSKGAGVGNVSVRVQELSVVEQIEGFSAKLYLP